MGLRGYAKYADHYRVTGRKPTVSQDKRDIRLSNAVLQHNLGGIVEVNDRRGLSIHFGDASGEENVGHK
jgi:hypothetical protein